SVKFVKPVLHGEEVTVTGEVVSRDARGITAAVRATTASTGECAVLTATLPAGSPIPVNVALYREAPLPAQREPGPPAYFDTHPTLGTFGARYDVAQCEEYVAAVSDPLTLYRGGDGSVHPAFLLHLSNRCLRANVVIGPWIHVGSVVRHLASARVGATLAAR